MNIKRFLVTLLVLLASTTAGIAVQAQVARAQAVDPCANASCPPAVSSTEVPGVNETTKQIVTNPPGPGGTEDAQYAGVMMRIMSLFAWLLGVAAITLDNAVYYTVVTMGSIVNNISAIGVTWRILRDIGNIALIFGFLAIGLSIILNSNLYGWSKNLLPKLLMAAVAMNFSLFFAEAVIDTGNLFATQFYTQINGGNPAQPTGYSANLYFWQPGNGEVTNEGISNKIMGQLGMQTIYGAARTNKLVLQDNNQIFIGFMGIILFLVTSFVMFSLAFMLIARFVTLVLVIITAPIGLAGFAIPKLQGIAEDWKKQLIDQTITAPIMLLMLYVALAVITDVHFLTGFCAASGTTTNPECRPDWLGFAQGSNYGGFASMMLSFIVAMGLLLAVVVLSKKLGAAGSSWATKQAGALTFGATAWAGRSSGGWLANKGANYARSTWIGRVPLAGTGLVRGLDRVAGSSFDVRSTNVLKNMPLLGNIDAGAAQKGGYKAQLKSSIESRTKYSATLKGRELTPAEKVQIALQQNKINDAQKRLATATTEAEVKRITGEIKGYEATIESYESQTDKGAQRKYAKVLRFGLDKDNPFNKYLNVAANTEAAKKILSTAKESSEDKTLKALIKKASAEETTPTPPPAASGGGGTA